MSSAPLRWTYYVWRDLRDGSVFALQRRSHLGHVQTFNVADGAWLAVQGDALSRAIENGDPLLEELSPRQAALLTGTDLPA